MNTMTTIPDNNNDNDEEFKDNTGSENHVGDDDYDDHDDEYNKEDLCDDY